MQKLEIQDCKIELVYLTNESMHSHQDIEKKKSSGMWAERILPQKRW